MLNLLITFMLLAALKLISGLLCNSLDSYVLENRITFEDLINTRRDLEVREPYEPKGLVDVLSVIIDILGYSNSSKLVMI